MRFGLFARFMNHIEREAIGGRPLVIVSIVAEGRESAKRVAWSVASDLSEQVRVSAVIDCRTCQGDEVVLGTPDDVVEELRPWHLRNCSPNHSDVRRLVNPSHRIRLAGKEPD
jgi:hypothetical protein